MMKKKCDPNWYYHFGTVDQGVMVIKVCLHSPMHVLHVS